MITRRVQQHHKKRKAQKLEEAQKELALFERGPGQVLLRQAQEAVPLIRGARYTMIPGGPLSILQLSDSSKERAVSSCAWACAQKSSNLGTQLSAAWEKHHELVEPSADQPPPPHPRRPKESKCKEAGQCLCTGSGILLQQLRLSLEAAVKQNLQNPDIRHLVLDGRVVLRFSQNVHPGQSASSNASPEVWLSIPLLYLSPFKPCFHQVHPIQNPEPWVYPVAQPRTYVQASLPHPTSH